MMKANAVDLITVSPEAGGVGLEPTESKPAASVWNPPNRSGQYTARSKASDSRKPIWQWVKG